MIDVQQWQSRSAVMHVIETLGGRDGATRLVGGAVRDHLLQIPVNDVDLATRLRPTEVMERLQQAGIKAVPTGIDHGTITAVEDGQPIEVTTLRKDVSTDGRRATIDYTDDWQEDAARRDFTFNALYADPFSGEVFDYFAGLADLEARRVRFIGDPLRRIAEDHLRILRFFRFHARFGEGEPNREALIACAARANDLMALSRERIADELLKLLSLPDPAPTVGIMLQHGLLKPVLPEIEEDSVRRLETLIIAERSAGSDPHALRRLAALLPPEPPVAERIGARLKLSNKARARLACSADRDVGADPRALAYRVGTECAVDRLLLASRPDDASEIGRWVPPRLPVSGGELIAQGVPQGPLVARTLRAIEERWLAAGFPSGSALRSIVEEAVAAAGR